MDRLQEYLQIAIDIAVKSGEMMREVMSSENCQFGTETKRNRIDLVTQFDRSIEKYIFNSLKMRFPDHAFIGEESASASSACDRIESDRPTWIVDPIDGTMNFVHRNPLCCVAIALAIDRRMVLGVVNAPFLAKLYTASEGGGAYCNGVRINVSRNAHRIEHSLLFSELNADRNDRERKKYFDKMFNLLMWRCRSVRNIGSACVSLAMIAEGSGDLFVHDHLCIWDMAAGYVLIREAGGVMMTLDGDRFDPHSHNCLAAANEELAKCVARITARSEKV